MHLIKLAVGVATVEDFEARVAQRRAETGTMSVWTRSLPRRADDILDGGSLFWVVAGMLAVRQPVLAIEEDTYDDGSRCARIDVEPTLIRVLGRPVRPFQGWRYLLPDQAAPDLACGVVDYAGLPPGLAQDLRELCLL